MGISSGTYALCVCAYLDNPYNETEFLLDHLNYYIITEVALHFRCVLIDVYDLLGVRLSCCNCLGLMRWNRASLNTKVIEAK